MQVKRPKSATTQGILCTLMQYFSGWCIGTSFVVLVFIILYVEIADVDESFDLEPKSRSMRLSKEATKKLSTTTKQASSSTTSAAVYLASNFCHDAFTKVSSAEWEDPNNGEIYEREMITTPHFHISVHNKDYDPVRWKIIEEGKYYEDEVHARFVDILKTAPSGSTVLDVGSNIGYYTLLSAAMGANCIAFEPNPTNLLRLCDSLRLNNWLGTPSDTSPQVRIYRAAVGEEHGSNMMLHVPRNPGMGFLRAPDEAKDKLVDKTHIFSTTMLSLDQLAESEGWFKTGQQIEVLKVDVEGKEPQVVLGAKKLLQSGQVKHVLMEGRRFGRANLQQSYNIMFGASFTVREPKIDFGKDDSPTVKTQKVVKYYEQKLGKVSQRVMDLWWELES